MDHIAIMKKSWRLTPKIISGEKTVESRWYKTRRAPWGEVKKGDRIYFKNSGEPISVVVSVRGVNKFEVKSNKSAIELMRKFIRADTGSNKITNDLKDYIKDKKYAIFIHFNKVKRIKPFDIDKKGFGMQSAWICVEDIKNIKIHPKV